MLISHGSFAEPEVESFHTSSVWQWQRQKHQITFTINDSWPFTQMYIFN